VDKAVEAGIIVDQSAFAKGLDLSEDKGSLADRWITESFTLTARDVNVLLQAYRFDEAASLVYQFFWGDFCDWYLEIAKIQLDFTEGFDRAATQKSLQLLVAVYEASLRLLSPFMPFLTEELWHAVYDGSPPAKSIALAGFPAAVRSGFKSPSHIEMEMAQRFIVAVRALRKEMGVEEKAITPIEVRADLALRSVLIEINPILQKLARVSEVRFVQQISPGLSKRSDFDFDVAVIYERTVDVAAERERLTKDIAKYEKGLAAAERQLGSEAFLGKAPAHVVEGLKKQEAETRLLLEKAMAALEALPKK